MISFKELLNGHVINDVSIADQHNLEELLVRINKVREAWGKPMRVTSGFRSMQEHLRIYSEIAHRKGIPFDRSKVPMLSKHLCGKSVDIADPDGSLYQWLKDNEYVLCEAQLWCESDTRGWVHFQIVPPASGKRWFIP